MRIVADDEQFEFLKYRSPITQLLQRLEVGQRLLVEKAEATKSIRNIVSQQGMMQGKAFKVQKLSNGDFLITRVS